MLRISSESLGGICYEGGKRQLWLFTFQNHLHQSAQKIGLAAEAVRLFAETMPVLTKILVEHSKFRPILYHLDATIRFFTSLWRVSYLE